MFVLGLIVASALCGFGGFGCFGGLGWITLVCLVFGFVVWFGRFLGLWFRWRIWLLLLVGVCVAGCSYWVGCFGVWQ